MSEAQTFFGLPPAAQNGMGFNSLTQFFELGGDLIRPTQINASVANPLSITGLAVGDLATDTLVVVDPAGVLKFVNPSGFPDFWKEIVNGVGPDGITDTTDAIRRLGHVGIGGLSVNDAMPTVTTPSATNDFLHLSSNAAGRGQLMFGSAPLSYYMTRAVPAAINDYVEVCSWTQASQASVFRLAVDVSDGGFAASKMYEAAVNWHATAGAWRVLRPLSDGGAFGANNYELLINVNNGVVALRLRRTGGATAGTFRIRLENLGDPTTVLTELAATATDVTAYTVYDPFPFSVDFWRSGGGTTLPDGTTDTADVISRTGAVVVGSNTQVGTSLLSVVSDTNTITDPIASFQANNLTQGVDILWNGIVKSGTAANSPLTINAKGTGNIILHGATAGEPASTGLVGINIANPTARLHVSGANANAGATPLFRLADTALPGSNIAIDNGAVANAYRLIVTAANLELQAAGNSNQVVVHTNGGVGFGTNAPTAGVGNISVNVNGFKPGGGAWGAFSDERLKEKIQPITYGLEEILALRPVTFQYNGKGGYEKDGRTHYGLIAQEVKQILPEFVQQVNDWLIMPQAISSFEAILIKAVQQLNHRVVELERNF